MQEIIINTDKENTKTILLVENGKLLEQYEEKECKDRLEGNIYLGKVQNILQGMQAAFVDIGTNKNTFIHLKDILPKVDITKNEQIDETSNIKDVIKKGMPILVQVKRDSTNKKGARVSTHISLVSRFFVLMPDTEIITISQKIENEKEKQRLITLVKEHLPKNMGVIIRTSGNKKLEEELVHDLESLIQRWKNIQKKVKTNTEECPILIEKNEGLITKIITDTIDQKTNKIIVNDKKVYKEVESVLKGLGCIENVEIVLKDKENILDIYELESQLEKTKNRKIWLKCGGFITIDKTEALTAIDVNSGKYIGNQSLEQTVFKVNQEASIEIGKQLRVRDIGGIIVIDYIDMKKEENKNKIIEVLTESLKNDRSKTQVLGFTKLNLLEMTRKHMCSND